MEKRLTKPPVAGAALSFHREKPHNTRAFFPFTFPLF
ncbi:hypothetical protein B23_0531 [Geobacillus thermoleovorans B23]|nr:hypothetical protein B23_0531 [Geobacillus thermoleovorans B23]